MPASRSSRNVACPVRRRLTPGFPRLRAIPEIAAGWLVARLVLLLLAIAAAPGFGAMTECEGIPAVVTYRDEADARTACRGAADAVGFLRGHGLDTGVPLEINILEECVERHGWPVMGQTDTRVMRIEVLSYDACQRAARNHPILGVPMSRELHSSFVAHEVAHAIARYNFADNRPPVAAHEYIAYVTQFATMDPGLRQQVLEHHRNPAWESLDDISETVYLLGPEVFAVKSYRHFLASPRPREVLARLLKGSSGRRAE